MSDLWTVICKQFETVYGDTIDEPREIEDPRNGWLLRLDLGNQQAHAYRNGNIVGIVTPAAHTVTGANAENLLLWLGSLERPADH